MEDRILQYEELNKYSNVGHLITKKPFNFNWQKNGKEKIMEQFDELQDLIGYKFKKILFPFQRHTNNVEVITNDNLDNTFDGIDGTITNLKGVALVCSLADCQGIILYDDNKKVIGNIHSGWKGTKEKIIVNAINKMIETFNSDPKDIKVFFSPSIQKCCFEVDEDVKDIFVNSFDDIDEYIIFDSNKNKYFIDTVGINKRELIKLGILKENIFDLGICTKCNSDIYHSHRGDPITDGRNISVVFLK